MIRIYTKAFWLIACMLGTTLQALDKGSLNFEENVKMMSVGNRFFLYQKNLFGSIVEIGDNEENINFKFTGKIQAYISGRQVGDFEVDQSKQWVLEMDVVHFPIVIKKWDHKGYRLWPLGDPDWRTTLATLKLALDDGRKLVMSVRLPQFMFSETGDACLLKAFQIAILDENIP